MVACPRRGPVVDNETVPKRPNKVNDLEAKQHDESKQVKVLFRTPAEKDEAFVETLWAIPQGGDLYKLDNNPIYPYGVSSGDIVEAPFDPDEQFRKFTKVVIKSGNKTVRIIFDKKVEESKEDQAILDKLVQMGCDYEGLNQIHFSINVPSSANFKEVCEFLTALKIQWEHADPSYDELYGGKNKKWWWPF